MILHNAKAFAAASLAGAILIVLSACAHTQTTAEACRIIDNIGKEADAQARDDAQQRRHLETSLQQVANPELKEYTDQILSELQSAKSKLSDLETTTQRGNEKAAAETRQTILKQTSSAIGAIKAESIDRICR